MTKSLQFSHRKGVIASNMTKRHMKIMVFILNLMQEKDYAFIPRLSDFELAGISRTKIKAELEEMERLNIITWDRKEGIFMIKDEKTWKTTNHRTWDESRYERLMNLNS